MSDAAQETSGVMAMAVAVPMVALSVHSCALELIGTRIHRKQTLKYLLFGTQYELKCALYITKYMQDIQMCYVIHRGRDADLISSEDR